MGYARTLLVVLTYSFSEVIFGIPFQCNEWFSTAKVSPGLMCMLDCLTITTVPTTSICPNWCPDLCELNFGGVAFFQVSKLYPALTISERALVSEFPWEMTRAYASAWKAEGLCLKLYRGSTTNDESDACRHFIWAGLLTNYFGPKFSVAVLDAHENSEMQPVEEKAMDLSNNRAGVLACENLRVTNQCTGES